MRPGTQWARHVPSDAGRRPAHPGCPMIRAGGPRTQDGPLYGLEVCARRNPMGVTYLAMRAGGPCAREPNGRVTYLAMRAGGPRTREPNGRVTYLAMRAGGPRTREPDGRHVPSDAGRRPARPGCPMIRAGGLRSQARVAIGRELCGHRMQPEAKSCEPAHSRYRCFHQLADSTNSGVSGCN